MLRITSEHVLLLVLVVGAPVSHGQVASRGIAEVHLKSVVIPAQEHHNVPRLLQEDVFLQEVSRIQEKSSRVHILAQKVGSQDRLLTIYYLVEDQEAVQDLNGELALNLVDQREDGGGVGLLTLQPVHEVGVDHLDDLDMAVANPLDLLLQIHSLLRNDVAQLLDLVIVGLQGHGQRVHLVRLLLREVVREVVGALHVPELRAVQVLVDVQLAQERRRSHQHAHLVLDLLQLLFLRLSLHVKTVGVHPVRKRILNLVVHVDVHRTEDSRQLAHLRHVEQVRVVATGLVCICGYIIIYYYLLLLLLLLFIIIYYYTSGIAVR